MKPAFVLLLLAVSSFGQSYRKHNVTLNGGAGLPGGDLKDLFSTSPGVGVSYGYRLHPYFQADVGYDALFGAADVRDFLPTAFGNLRIRDYQHFLPFGGRAILPLFGDKVQIYGGGGGVYMRYSERIRQPYGGYGYQLDCNVCAVRDGVGYYGVVGAMIALDDAQHFRLGGGTRVYRGTTSGDPLGAAPPRETNDRWTNIFGAFSVSF